MVRFFFQQSQYLNAALMLHVLHSTLNTKHLILYGMICFTQILGDKRKDKRWVSFQ